MRVLIVVDHYPLSPRVIKINNIYKKKGFQTRILAWDRSENDLTNVEENVDVLKQPLGYGNRVKKLFNLSSMKKSVENTISLFQPNIVHAIDFEMAWLVSTILKKAIYKFKLFYEVYDIKYFANRIINNFRIRKEREVIEQANLIIFASPFFPNYYDKIYSIDKPQIVLNNKPSIAQIESSNYREHGENPNCIDKSELIISFIGTVRYYDILKNLIYATEDINWVKVDIYGDGPDLEKIKAIKHDNVRIYGRFDVEELPEIYSKIDITWACYPSSNENVKYAVSNKYFESLYFAKPILVSSNTYLGDKVNTEKTGLAIDATSVEEIKTAIHKLKSMNFNLPVSQNYKYTWEYEEEQFLKLLDSEI